MRGKDIFSLTLNQTKLKTNYNYMFIEKNALLKNRIKINHE